MRYPAYPRYKPSGVEWLGDVPEHWEVKKLKHVLKEIVSGGTPEVANEAFWAYGADEGYDWVSISDMTRDYLITATDRRITERGRRSKNLCIVPAGTLLYSMYASLGKIAILGIPASFNQAILGLIPELRKLDQRYVAYWLNNIEIHLELFSSSNTQDNLNVAKISAMPIFLPSIMEQRTIADFLDSHIAKIDTLLAKKRELIEKLKEKRTALISRTVTRGLPPGAVRAAGFDPHPKLKSSGIDWLGDIPTHWEVKPLGYLVRFHGGATPDKGKPEYWEGEIPWVSPKDMKQARLDDAEDHISIEGLQKSTLTLMPTGAVLIVVRGMILAHSFPVAIADASLTINQDMKALLCGHRVLPDYLAMTFTGLGRALVSLADESAHGTRKLESLVLAKFRLPVPPLSVQRAIVDFLHKETAKIDRMIDEVDEAIARLQEYRTALITAAVTGKIDVREATA